ncbi:MAG: LuxR C-terminal-related transcriptional regulator, partial [Treponema sp.]|nr:LuxR C-terminal-related transcriptional regulator [Treponema sp.]
DFDTLVKVRCLLIEKKYPEALLALKLAQAKSEIKAYLFGVLEMTVLEAVIRHRLKDREGALAALKKAYDIARPWALNMPFIELGEAMYGMAGAILKIPPSDPHSAESAGIPREWLQAIRRSASANAKKCSLVAAQYAGREAPAPADFSQHELAILGSLSLGRTGEEIAVSMKISANMVKSVIRSLYVKLGAANRADAIRIATERGLLTNIPGK